jgi:hypothetical protein
MSAKRVSSRPLDLLSRKIIQDLKDRFVEAGHGSNALGRGYEGVPIKQLTERVRDDTGASQVDFDLSLKHLEERKLITTGPMASYDNRPGSGVFFLGFYSKREYACITEDGYRVLTQLEPSQTRAKGVAPINIGHIGSFVGNLGHGNVSGSITVSDLKTEQIGSIIPQLRAHRAELVAAGADGDTLDVLLRALEKALGTAQPDHGVLRGLLTDLRNSLSGAAGSLVATGAINVLNMMLGTGVPSP